MQDNISFPMKADNWCDMKLYTDSRFLIMDQLAC